MDYKKRNISPNETILNALKQMDRVNVKLLIVEECGNFIGLLSVGDIQRAIINNLDIHTPIKNVLRKNIRIGRKNNTFEDIKNMMLDYRMEMCPVVSEDGKIEKIYYWEDLFEGKKPKCDESFNLPVVIMAGGIGTRLKPLTNVLPKPLIPIGEKTMLEEIFDRFSAHGCKNFFISVNYKGELIKFYIENQNLPYNIEYFQEDKPMGTAGSLSLLKGKIKETFFVTNCDILIEQDYSEILNYHKENKNEITIVAALKHFPISYGTIETGKNGKLINLIEKPELTFKINSGMYILEPNLIDKIPEKQFYNITDLIHTLMKSKRTVGVFPVSEKSWIDIGEWRGLFNSISYLRL